LDDGGAHGVTRPTGFTDHGTRGAERPTDKSRA